MSNIYDLVILCYNNDDTVYIHAIYSFPTCEQKRYDFFITLSCLMSNLYQTPARVTI